MKTDIEIAQEAAMLPIKDVAASIGVEEDDLELYGQYKAKFSESSIQSKWQACACHCDQSDSGRRR